MKYGYESADTFGVAFKCMHSIAPNMVRKTDIQLKFYSRLHFTLIIKGVDEIDFRVIDKDSFNVVGVRRTTPYGGGTWAIVKSDGSIEKMQEITGEGFISLVIQMLKKPVSMRITGFSLLNTLFVRNNKPPATGGHDL